jgi:hypothetical protein
LRLHPVVASQHYDSVGDSAIWTNRREQPDSGQPNGAIAEVVASFFLATLETQASTQQNIFAEQFSCRLLTLSAGWHGAMHFR